VWLTENGLPQNTIHSITQARDGYVWLATEEGLARFDGIKFTVFDKQNTPELKSNDIRVLLEDRRGALWIGTADGLVRLLDAKFTAFTSRDGLPSNVIDALCEDHDGSLFVANHCRNRALWRERLHPSPEFPKDGVRALFADREGALWIGSSAGLARYQNGAIAKYTVQDGLANNNIVSIDQDKAGQLWVGTTNGLNQFDGNRFLTYTTRDGLPNNRIISLAVDREGSVWIGTAGGVSRFADGHFSSFRLGDGLANEIILSIFEDREGSLWLGTESGGTEFVEGQEIYHLHSQRRSRRRCGQVDLRRSERQHLDRNKRRRLESLERWKVHHLHNGRRPIQQRVLALFGDGDGNLWVGTPDGLNRFRDGKFKHLLPLTGWPMISSDQSMRTTAAISGLARAAD